MPTDTQLRLEGVYKVVEWMRIRTAEGYSEYDTAGLECDLRHSALIHWLCQGNEALAEAPPVRFSRPDHQAAVDGRFTPMEVCVWKEGTSLIVDHDVWKVVEAKGPENWLASYKTKQDGSAWSAPWNIKRGESGWIAERPSGTSQPDAATAINT